MKTSRIVFFLAGIALLISTARFASAEDAAAPSSVPSNDQGARGEKLKAALTQLDLTDDQKAKIKDIFTNVTDKKERRHQIAAVLTPDQKAKLKQMIQERRDNPQASGATTK